MSQYTGRVHLYICIPGTDERPRPIFENFRPEELKSILVSAGNTFKEASPETLKTNPAYWNVIKKFFEEWNGLRPIERNKLLGKPLQLPLIAELCYLKDSINHVHGVCSLTFTIFKKMHMLCLFYFGVVCLEVS